MNGIETEHSALRLAQYLKEFVRHRTPPVSDIDKYEAVLWFADIPQEADCRSGAWTDDWEQGDAWLEVERQAFEPAPELPEIVIPWVDEQAFKRATPEIPPLHASISVPDEEAELAEGETPPVVERALVDHPEVQAAYGEYRPSWEAWSMEHRRREAIQEIYAELFRLRTQVLKQGEIVEAVLGLGLLHWRTETSLTRRHVVVASVELTFDPDKGVIRIGPLGEGAQLRIEDEMLDANFRPDRAHYEAVREQLDEIGDDLWDMARMTSALRTWTQALSADAQWSPEIRAQSRELSGPAVRFAPALILRKRPQIGMLRVYDALIDQLSGDSPKIPNGWGGLVEDGGFGGSNADETSTVQSPEDRPSEIYFPLPKNREQEQIVEAFNRQRGVLVQGPPGTGKSHTIANLICHLLATGQRVLVTAETAQALRVVKDKLPEELQPLCISLLGQGGDAFAELSRSVQGITTRQASYAQGDDHRISEVEDELEIPLSRDRGQVRADTEVVISHMKSGGKWKRFGLFTPQKLKGREYLRDEVFVDGAGASDSERLQAVSDYLDTEFARDNLRKIWDGVDAEPLPDDLRQALAVAKEQLSALEEGRDYAGTCNDLSRIMTTASPPVPVPDWLNGEVVVGDDQQISPYGIGIPDDAIADLQRRYLDGIPHHHASSPQSSLYGNAKIRFSGRNIVLQEHFRCMPEIIQFSNDLCYAPNGTPLDPLRTYPANRLEPLILRHVADGYRTGGNQNAQNPPEADAIVEQITACIADSRYTKKTMGVISLQGEAQAKLIERKLLECVDLEQIEERRLICGDAYAFQGDERDIIFLSMVAAERDENGQPQRIGTLADESAKQRFNVAASRARDQLWLFHTAIRDALSDKCMRRKLLEYMLDPSRRATEEQDQRFDSDFERNVFRRITDRGFRVRTQVGVGDTTNHRYRIDLVVEGMQGRLAVECDGDQWHGPERYEQDMARQRDLERVGWQFARIRGGDFYRDPDKAMEPVWDELDRLGIIPGGIDSAAAEPPQPPSSRVSEGDASVSSESPEVSLGDTEPGASVPQDMEASMQPTRQGVFEFDAEGPLALQPMQSPSRVDDSSAYKTKEREYDTAELDWYDVKDFFRSHGCPTSGGTEMRWYEESWGAIMRSGLASTSKYEKDEHGEIIIKLRAMCLLAMYLGMYQQGGHMEGYFNDHPWGLSGYLEELGINKKTLLELLNINKKEIVEVEDVLVPRLADVRDIVGEDYLDNLDDLLDDLDRDDPDRVDWEKLADLVEWGMIEEVALKLVRDENSSIYNVLENHYGGKNLLFVSIWNSRLPFHESEPASDVLSDVSIDFSDEITGQKLMMWFYVEEGMCHWSI